MLQVVLPPRSPGGVPEWGRNRNVIIVLEFSCGCSAVSTRRALEIGSRCKGRDRIEGDDSTAFTIEKTGRFRRILNSSESQHMIIFMFNISLAWGYCLVFLIHPVSHFAPASEGDSSTECYQIEDVNVAFTMKIEKAMITSSGDNKFFRSISFLLLRNKNRMRLNSIQFQANGRGKSFNWVLMWMCIRAVICTILNV